MLESGTMDRPKEFDEIVGALRALHQSGEKMPSERVLAEKLSVKRHQLRKALAQLREAGDVPVPQPRKSPARSTLSNLREELVRITNPLEVLELRFILEPGFARLASLRATALDIRNIQLAAKTPDGASSGEVDLSFHMAIASASRNMLAQEFYRMLRQVGVDARVQLARQAPVTCPKRIGQRDEEHRLIADAISRRDPDGAEAAMRAHLESVRQRINERTNAFAA